VSFGLANCGAANPLAPLSYSFQNTGPVAISWSATVDSVFAIQGAASGTVAPGATGSISVGVTAIPATATAGVAITGTLTLVTNVPGFTGIAVPLTVTPQGGSLTVSAAPGFGSITVGTPATQPFTLQNVGNAPVSVTLGTPSDPEFTATYTGAPAGAAIAAGASLAGAGATFTPTSAGMHGATVAIQTVGVMCASAATSVSLSGTGTTNPLSISASTLNYGTVTCGTAAPWQALTITNSNAIAFPYTTSLGKGRELAVHARRPDRYRARQWQGRHQRHPRDGPALSATLTAGFYDDTLTFTAQGETPVPIALDESAGGAILALTMATTNFGTVLNTTASLPFTLTNTGNQDATVTVAAGGAHFGETISTNDVPAGGSPVTGTASFTAAANAAAVGSLAVSASNLCNPQPTTLTLNAVGAVPVATVGGALAVTATCGGAVTNATLALTNTGNAPLTLGSIASTSGYFAVVSSTSPIAAQGSGSIVIKGVVPPNPVGSNTALADTLSFTTNEVGLPTHKVAVGDTVMGANLAVSPNPVDGSCDEGGGPYFNVVNTGNLAATAQGGTGYTCGTTAQFNFNFYCSYKNAVSIPVGGMGPHDTVRWNGAIMTPTCPDANAATVSFVTTGNVCSAPLTMTIAVVTANCNCE
jgi:hypothetical protein